MSSSKERLFSEKKGGGGKMKENLKVGDYEVNAFEKGKCETALEGNWFKGCIFYTIRLEDGYLDTSRQEIAEIISRLVRIECLLKKK